MYVVVGAGWYGCRVAQELERLGEEFGIVDKSGDFFSESSSKNQNRLHVGFHYPRCSRTRRECKAGFGRFAAEYPTSEVTNAYLVAKRSKVDFGTYRLIYDAENVPFRCFPVEESAERLGVCLAADRIDGEVVMCDERLIDFRACGAMMRERLAKHLLPEGSRVRVSDPDAPTLDGEPVVHVFDCTYGHLTPLPVPASYEVCVSFVYRAPPGAERTAITVMDGDFFSIYPYERGRCTVTHVKHTPLRVFDSPNEASEYRASDACGADCLEARRLTEEHVGEYIPGFRDIYQYEGFFVSVKTKFGGSGSDDRSLRVFRKGKVTSMVGGKITGIFDSDQVVRDVVAASRAADKP
jgi:hypothetical protein